MIDPHDSPTLPPSPNDTAPHQEAAVKTLPSIPGFFLESELGRGGMGVVYLARQVRLNRLVALKMILSADHADADTRLRFLHEAETIAKLQHPGIVQVYEFGTHENNPYFALEYISGGSLDKKLAGTPLPPRDAAALIEKLARAVQAAHDQGIIHRDLKPANILIQSPESAVLSPEKAKKQSPLSTQNSALRTNHPKITDFGLVKQEGSDMTATGAILGTPSYMAPEQADGKKNVGPAADIYALGAILYECLTGRPPFKAATPLDTILQVVNDDPVSIRQLQAKTPVDLETICHKCLQKEPAKRYRRAEELAEDLGSYLKGEPIAARPVSSMERAVKWVKRHRTLTIAAFSTAAALLVGLGVALIETNRAIKERNKSERLLALQANREGMRLMEQDNTLAAKLWFTMPLTFASNQAEITDISRLRLGTRKEMTNQQIYCKHILPFNCSYSSTSDCICRSSNAIFSPDGHWICCVKDSTICLYDATTGMSVSEFKNPMLRETEGKSGIIENPTCIAFSPDGTRICIAYGKRVQVWDCLAGIKLPNTDQPLSPPMLHQSNVEQIRFNKDSSRIVTATNDYATRDNVVQAWDISTGKSISPQMHHQSEIVNIDFSADGHRILTVAHDNALRSWRISTGECEVLTKAVERKGNDIMNFMPCKGMKLSLDKRHVLIHLHAYPNDVMQLLDAGTGKQLVPKREFAGKIIHANFYPYGARIISVTKDHKALIWDMKEEKPLSPSLQHQDEVVHANFSPDGRSVVTVSKDNSVRLWDIASGQLLSPQLVHPSIVFHAVFSPDGRSILTSSNDKLARLWDVSNLRWPSIRLDHQGDVMHASFNHDGSKIITASADWTAQVWNATTGDKVLPPTKHDTWLFFAKFSPDGSCFVTVSQDPFKRGNNAARIWDASTGQPRSLPLKHDGKITQIDFCEDGRNVITISKKDYDIVKDDRGIESYKTVDMATVWDTENGNILSTLEALAYSPNGLHAVTNKPTLRLKETLTDKIILPTIGGKDGYGAMSAKYNYDGNRIAITYGQGVRLYDASTGRSISPLIENVYGQQAIMNRDGSKVITSLPNKAVRVWDAETGQAITPPVRFKSAVSAVEFNPNGDCFVAATDDGNAAVYDSLTGQSLSPTLQHGKRQVKFASFSPDGRRIVTASDNAAHIWHFTPETRPAADLLKLAQVYASHKIDDTGGLQPLDVEMELVPWFKEMKAKYPEEFIPKYEDTRRWRLKQIEDCCKEKNLPAAFFHQHWLLAEAVVDTAQARK